LLKGDYEEFHALGRRKNKPNSKPNKANLSAFGRKSEARNPKQVERMRVEKTKPICWSSNLHNVSNSNGLWGFRRLEAA